MPRKRKEFYKAEALIYKKKYYKVLPEKQRRHFLGQEYIQLGKDSQRYLSRVFGCSRNTIIKGKEEISNDNFKPDYSRQRKSGGGAKKKKNK